MLSTKKALGLASMTAALVCTLGMGVKANAAEVTPPPTETINGVTCQKMLRFYNPYTYEHLYTPSEEEAASLRAAGWNEEGIGWYSPVKGTQGVETIYRLYNPWGDDHLYTTNAKEKDDCLARGMKLDYKFEAYGFAAKSEVANQPVYRLFNPYEQEHTHFFTTNPSEVSDSVARGWKDEHEQWFVPGKPAETPAAGVSNVIIGVGTGTGSNPSSSSESSTPSLSKELSKEQKAVLNKAKESVKDLVDATRKAATTVTTAAGKTLTGEEAVKELTTRATAAQTAYNEAKKASDAKPNDAALKAKTDAAALVQKEKEFEAEYAKNLNLLAQKKAELDKKPNDDKAKQAFNEAKTAVETDEKKVVPVTYTLHFTNDPKGTATLKDTQVTVYKCIATQMYGKSEEAVTKTASARYTEAAAVLDVVNDTHEVKSGDKLQRRRVRYNAETKAYDVTFTAHDIADATPKAHNYQVPALAKDEHAPSGLPELNMTLCAKDTSAYHATKDDKVGDLNDKIAAITKDTVAQSPYLKLPSYRTTQVTREFVETEGKTQATKDALNKQWKAFKQEADAPAKNPDVQLCIYKLKKAELEYSSATTDEAKLQARKDAIEAAAYLINPQREYVGMDRVSYKPDPEYVHYMLLMRLKSVLNSEAPKTGATEDAKKNYNAYVDAYGNWMNNPKDAKLTEAVKAAYKKYTGKEAAFSWDINQMID